MLYAFRICIGFVCLFIQEPRAEEKLPAEKPLTPEAVASRYFEGNGFVNSSIHLMADGRFVYQWFADDGGRHRDEGTFTIEDMMISFKISTFVENQKKTQDWAIHPKLNAIRWGKRIYLIPDTQMESFCYCVNLGAEPRVDVRGRFYANQERKEVDGRDQNVLVATDDPAEFPPVPVRWRSFLLKKPVEGKIVAKLSDGHAKVDIGSTDGIKKGMVLVVERGMTTGGKDVLIFVKIVETQDHVSVIKELSPSFQKAGLEVDEKVSTKVSNKNIGSIPRNLYYLELP